MKTRIPCFSVLLVAAAALGCQHEGAPPPRSRSSSTPDASLAPSHPAASAAHRSAAPIEPSVGDVRVPKAEGKEAKTVAEVFAERETLKNRSVAVRGTVVKSLSGIMGRNWLHVRDGSGSSTAKDDDLTVTSLQSAAVGDVVTVKGTVHVDRDFGAGYRYPVIVEDATFVK
jgi:hypothetical protein